MSRQSEIHNKMAGKVVQQIVRAILNNGGKTSSVRVLLESVVTGVLLACERIDGSKPSTTDSMLMGLESSVRDRIFEIREGKLK